MQRVWRAMKWALGSGLFTPMGLVTRAAALLAIFGVFHWLGWRDEVRIISGTSLPADSGADATVVKGLAYAAAYFAAVVVCPILVLGAGVQTVIERGARFRQRTGSDDQSRSA